jgi:hypothetical protein
MEMAREGTMARTHIALLVFGVALVASAVGVAAAWGGDGVRGVTAGSFVRSGGGSGRRRGTRSETPFSSPAGAFDVASDLGWERYRSSAKAAG